MANAEELFRDAYFAFQNVSPGSADEEKNTATAKRIAHRIIRKYPRSTEATQARTILRSLGEYVALANPTPITRTVHTSHRPVATPSRPHQPHFQRTTVDKEPTREEVVKKLAAVTEVFRQQSAASNSSGNYTWGGAWEKFSALSYFKKKVFGAIAIFIFIFFSSVPFLLLGLAAYAFKPRAFKKHVHAIIDAVA